MKKLKCLSAFPKLEAASLFNTKVSEEGVAALRKTMPKLMIV